MTEIYRNAFTEVYTIINYLDDNDYNKIPKEVIHAIEINRNKEYDYFLDETIPFTEQQMLPETRAILFVFFRDYLSTKEQNAKIVNLQRNERTKLEEEKRKIYNVDIFKNKEHDQVKEKNIKNLSLEDKNKNLFKKIILFIKKLFDKF